MEESSKKSILDKALENPRTTNGIIATVGAGMLVAYALLTTVEGSLNVAGFLILSDPLVKAVAVFFKELGLAAMVAVMINFSIEAFNRKRHDREKRDLIETINSAHTSQREEQIKAINEKIFQTVYERNIPSGLFKVIEEQVLRSNFIRPESAYLLRIEPCDEEHAKIIFRHTYKIKNVNSTQAAYSMAAGFDVIKSLSDKYEIRTFQAGKAKLEGEKLIAEKIDKTEVHEWWSLKLEQLVDPEETIECIVEFVRISPKVGKEAICSMLPTERMSIQVIDRECMLSVRAMTLHPRMEVVKQIDEAGGFYHWELDGALFPGQGFLVDWRPRNP